MRYTVVFICILLFLVPAIHAQDLFPEDLLPTIATDPEHTLKGGEYQLELSPLESVEPTSAKGTDTLSAKQREQFDKQGFVIQQTKGEITVSLSSSRIGLGSVTGAGEHTGNVEISAATNVPAGYTLLATQLHPDDIEQNWSFQPTMCNGDDDTCTPQKSALWTEESQYGLGYTLSGPDVPKDFKNNEYFRPLRLQFPLMIAGHEKINGIRTLSMKFKLQAPPSTEEAVYSTNVEVITLAK